MAGLTALVRRSGFARSSWLGQTLAAVGKRRQSWRTAEPAPRAIAPTPAGSPALRVAGCRLVGIPRYSDQRGTLSPIEFGSDLPFVPQRVFFIHGVHGGASRGHHAHRTCDQFMVAVAGEILVSIEDGSAVEQVTLDSPGFGLLVPAMVWSSQLHFDANSVLMVFASASYDDGDYIRDHAVFKAAVAGA